jgi:hypothetical protein
METLLKSSARASPIRGRLGVEMPANKRRHFRDILTLTGVYHDFDYGLFYENIRANVSTRILAWRMAAARHPTEQAS